MQKKKRPYTSTTNSLLFFIVKNLYFFFVKKWSFFLIYFILFSVQDLSSQLHHSSLSSVSSSNQGSNTIVLHSIGQMSVSGNFISNKISVVQGFQQPFLRPKAEEYIKNESIIVFPNPFSSDLNFKFGSIKPDNLTVDIYDVNGRFIKSLKINRIEDEIKLNLNYLMSTEYIIRLRGNNINYSTKVIKK